MPESPATGDRLPPARTTLVILGITVTAVLGFRFAVEGGPPPSVDTLPPPQPIEVHTRDEVVIGPGSIPRDALRTITLLPSRSHPFLRAIAYALIDELESVPGVDAVETLPEIASGAPLPSGLHLNLELARLDESRGIDPRTLNTSLRLELRIPGRHLDLPSLDVDQHAEIHGAETPTLWYREAAAAMVPGIVSNLVQAIAP